MSEPDFAPPPGPAAGMPASLREARIAIVGLGLIGGSLALALRGHCRTLLGVDTDLPTRALALQRHVVDRVSADPAGLLPQADLIILATPVQVILDLIRCLPSLHPGSAMILDLGSTKRDIVQALDDLPPRFDPLGGHPICGKEVSGLAHAEATLFQGAAFALTPLVRTSPHARSLAMQLARALGAQPVWLDPETHDRQVAFTSHLPYLLSAALTLATPIDAQPLIGPGFRGATRLAASYPAMMTDILHTNRDALLEALAQFQCQLDVLEAMLTAAPPEALEQKLVRVTTRRDELTAPWRSARR